MPISNIDYSSLFLLLLSQSFCHHLWKCCDHPGHQWESAVNKGMSEYGPKWPKFCCLFDSLIQINIARICKGCAVSLLVSVRDDWRLQNGWIFWKVPISLWPPPLHHLWKIILQMFFNFMLIKPFLKVLKLKHIFFLELFWILIVLKTPPVPYHRHKCHYWVFQYVKNCHKGLLKIDNHHSICIKKWRIWVNICEGMQLHSKNCKITTTTMETSQTVRQNFVSPSFSKTKTAWTRQSMQDTITANPVHGFACILYWWHSKIKFPFFDVYLPVQ